MITPALLGVVASQGRDLRQLLLVKGNGTDGGTSFVDSSPYNRTASVVGAVTTAFAADFYETSAVKFNSGASANYVLYTVPGGFLASSASEFTIEFWVRLTFKSSAEGYTDGRFSFLRLTSGGVKQIEFTAASTLATNFVIAIPGATNVSVGNYLDRVHIALVKSAGVGNIYVNGVAVLSPPSIADFNFTDVYIGNAAVTTRTVAGFIEDVCISSYAKYSANFTPPGSL